jgi:membrane protein required for colicin V production
VLLFDKLIGFIFGAFRGVLIVVLLFLGFKYLVGENLPEWLLEAYSFHYLDNIGDILKEIFLDEDVIVTKEQKI